MKLKAGEKILIRTGPFAGLAATILRNGEDEQSLIVSLNGMSTNISLELNIQSVVSEEDRWEAIKKKLQLEIINKQDYIIQEINKNPKDLFRLDPYEFEEIVAHLLADMGYSVKITPKSKDQGRDILAIIETPIHPILTIVECKKYRADRKVGIDLVERLLYTVDKKDNANMAMLVTTSEFTRDSLRLQKENFYRLSLKDFNSLENWISAYTYKNKINGEGIIYPKYLFEEI